jgi:hypothetical protein
MKLNHLNNILSINGKYNVNDGGTEITNLYTVANAQKIFNILSPKFQVFGIQFHNEEVTEFQIGILYCIITDDTFKVMYKATLDSPHQIIILTNPVSSKVLINDEIPIPNERGIPIIKSIILDIFIVFCVLKTVQVDIFLHPKTFYFDFNTDSETLNNRIHASMLSLIRLLDNQPSMELIFPSIFDFKYVSAYPLSLLDVRIRVEENDIIMNKDEREIDKNTINSLEFKNSIYQSTHECQKFYNNQSHLDVDRIYSQNSQRIHQSHQSLFNSLQPSTLLRRNVIKSSTHPDKRELDEMMQFYKKNHEEERMY